MYFEWYVIYPIKMNIIYIMFNINIEFKNLLLLKQKNKVNILLPMSTLFPYFLSEIIRYLIV